MAALLDTVRQNPPAENAGKKVVLYEDYLTATATAITGGKLSIDIPENMYCNLYWKMNHGLPSVHPEPSLNVNIIL